MSDWPNQPVIGTTLASLGSKEHGKTAFIRAGSSPYEIVGLTYDAVYGKWVSAANQFLVISANFSTGSASYVAVSSGAGYERPYILNYLDLYNAGLRLQLYHSTNITATNPGTATAGVLLFGVSDGDGSRTQYGSQIVELATTATSGAWKFSGWTDANPATPTKQHLQALMYLKSSSGTGTLGESQLNYRWVA